MNKSYEVVTDEIKSLMENNEVPWRKPWVTMKLHGQCNGVSKRPYSGLNALVLAMQEYNSPYWLTFSQGKKLGLELPKGSKACRVIGWFKGKRKDEETGEVEESKHLSAMFYRVFNFEQWTCPEGVVLPKHFTAVEKPVAFDNPRYDVAEKLVETLAVDLSEDGNAAYYVPMRDKVVVPNITTFYSSHEYYSTLFHEIGHWTGHEKRLKRFKSTDKQRFASTEYSAEELVAELCSVFVCSKMGISSDTTVRNSAAYLKGWLKFLKSDPKQFVYAAQRAGKAADMILKHHDEAEQDVSRGDFMISHETAYFDLGNEMQDAIPF